MWGFGRGYCFFFSSRRRHTRSLRDWSSDVCSSDLRRVMPAQLEAGVDHRVHDHAAGIRLVGIAAELPAFAEPARDRREIRLFAQHARESALAFDRPLGGGEIIFGEE